MTEQELGAEIDRTLDKIVNTIRVARHDLAHGDIDHALHGVFRIHELAMGLQQTASAARA